MDNNAMRPVKESDGKWGYEDKCHREIIPPVYKAAMPMYDGICWVKRLNWGARFFLVEVKRKGPHPK